MKKATQYFHIVVIAASLVLFLSACGGGGRTFSSSTEEDISLHYAENLKLIRGEGYIEARLRNPWDTTSTLHTYILVDKNAEVPQHIPDGTLVRTPLENALVYTAVHCSLIKELEAVGSIGGVCELQYIKVPEVIEGCRNGSIVDAGDGMNPDIEKIIDLHPDALMLSPFENSGGHGRVDKLDIPIIECADYMETSPLGRAEWMRFYGMLFGREAQADSLFAVVEEKYSELKQMVTDANPEKPTLITDLKSGSAWYVPGGKSTMGQLYADAGAQYVFIDRNVSSSIPLSFETVFERGQDAQLWLVKYNQPQDMTYEQMERDYAPYAGFRAFKERHIYGCNTAYVPFYEDFPFHPDLVLKDMIKIFHPDMLPDYEPKYYTPLK